MITGRWGKPSEVLLDIVEQDGLVTDLANPGRQNATIRSGRFDAATGAVHLEGTHAANGKVIPFRIDGRLEGRTLRLGYEFGEMRGSVELVRVEEYAPPPRTFLDRIKPGVEELKRWINSFSRPSGEANSRRLR